MGCERLWDGACWVPHLGVTQCAGAPCTQNVLGTSQNDPLIKRGMGKVVCANEAPILKAVAAPRSEAEPKSSLKGAVLCSCMKTLLKNQRTNQPESKVSQKIPQRAVWWTNTSETILGLIGEVLTAATQTGVTTLYFLLSHHTSGSFEATVAGVHVVKKFQVIPLNIHF